MTRRGETVSIRIHPTNKAVIDWLITNHRATTGQGMTNDEALWMVFQKGAPDAVKAVLAMGAQVPKDARPDELKRRQQDSE